MKITPLWIVIFIILLFIVANNLVFFPENILCWDVFGYYLYLPLKFIYHDLSIHDESIVRHILEEYQNSATFYQAMKLEDGTYVLKYTMGFSILYFPFFMIAHLVATLTPYATDGFSIPYQYAILFGGIVYSLLAIWVLARVLLNFFSENLTAIILILVVFSTNYIMHVTMHGQNANSHAYLFLMYALILWLTILWHKSHKMRPMLFLGLVCGITILSRPSEIVCLAIPVLWGVMDKRTILDKWKLLVKHYRQVLLFVLILVVIGSFQFIYWKIHTGKFLFNSYGGNAGEGFEFFRPNIFKVLFSFRKGWLIYTPVMLFALLGFIFTYKKNKPVFFALLVYFICNLYIVSSWSNWWYTQSFSQRALIPSYPVMAIPLGYFLGWLYERKKFVKLSGLSLLALLLILNIFQTIQAANGTLHGDRMTRAYYFRTFGKLHATEEDRKLLLVERSFDAHEYIRYEEEYKSQLLDVLDFEIEEYNDSLTIQTGNHYFYLDSKHEFSPAIEYSYNQITNQDHAWIRVTALVYPTQDIRMNPFSLVVHFVHNGYPYKYRTLDSENLDLRINEWNTISFDYLTPEVRRKEDNLKVYLWNRGGTGLYLDDLKVEVLEKQE